ncbi:MAG: CotH kinase family protein [Pirellulaceae bacterium]|jgi:spore coat protein CotH|nr:hypothetical protein [Planctomycetaceae bacterium]MDP7015519.1 CotH kinase family protein [Pirellulaceae bacterium]
MLHRKLSIPVVAAAVVALSAIQASAAEADLASDEVAAALFDTTKLLEVKIQISEEDWEELTAQRRGFASSFLKTPAFNPYTYFRGDVTVNGVTIKSVGIRKKGFFGSNDSVRPSLKIKLNEYAQGRVFGGLDRFTLNNNRQDRAHVSQVLSYGVFREAGLPAPRVGLAKVSVNGRPLGVYSHVESIRAPFLERNFGNSDGQMFEGVFPTDFYADRISRFEIKTRKKENDRSDLKEIAAILEKPGDDLVERLNEHFDVDEFIRFWAIESLVASWDGYAGNQNNFYIYKDAKDSKYHFIPWGVDASFSRSQLLGRGGAASVKAKGLICFHLYQRPGIREKYVAELTRLLDTVWNKEKLQAEVDRIEALVMDHLHESQERGFGDASLAAWNFIDTRKRTILDEIADGPVIVDRPPSELMYFKDVGKLAGSFQATWSDERQENAVELGSAKMDFELDGKPLEVIRQGVAAQPGRISRGFGQRQPAADSPPPPSVVWTIEVPGESENRTYRLTIQVSKQKFLSHNTPIRVEGSLSDGQRRSFGFFGGRTFLGELTLNASALKDGANVTGELKGRLYQMRGGFGRR